MTGFLAVEFESEADLRSAISALRLPSLVVTTLELWRREAVALIEVKSAEALAAASAEMARRPGVRSSTAIPA